MHLTSTDVQAAFATNDTTLSSGVGTFSVTLKTAGNQTVTAADTVNTGILGTSNTVTVTAAATAKFAVVGTPATVVAGTNATFTVTAEDTFGNLTPTYTGTVKFTTTDPLATPPAPRRWSAARAVSS